MSSLQLINYLFQQMRRESEAGQIYFIDVDTVNAGIPYADSFYVELSYCISSCGSELKRLESTNWRSRSSLHEAQLFVFASIKYKKTVWGLVKSKFCNITIPKTMFTLLRGALRKNDHDIIIASYNLHTLPLYSPYSIHRKKHLGWTRRILSKFSPGIAQ